MGPKKVKLSKNLHSSGALGKVINRYDKRNSGGFNKLKVNRLHTDGPLLSSSKYIEGISSDEETQYKKFRPSKKTKKIDNESSKSYSFSDNSFDEIRKFDQIRQDPVKIKKKKLVEIFSSVMPRAKDLILDLKQLK